MGIFFLPITAPDVAYVENAADAAVDFDDDDDDDVMAATTTTATTTMRQQYDVVLSFSCVYLEWIIYLVSCSLASWEIDDFYAPTVLMLCGWVFLKGAGLVCGWCVGCMWIFFCVYVCMDGVFWNFENEIFDF